MRFCPASYRFLSNYFNHYGQHASASCQILSLQWPAFARYTFTNLSTDSCNVRESAFHPLFVNFRLVRAVLLTVAEICLHFVQTILSCTPSRSYATAWNVLLCINSVIINCPQPENSIVPRVMYAKCLHSVSSTCSSNLQHTRQSLHASMFQPRTLHTDIPA